MTRARRVARSTAAVPLVLALALTAACGSSAETDVTPGGAGSAAPSSSGGSTPSGSATASVSPTTASGPRVYTSGLEDRPPVKALQAWAAAVAEEVNSRSADHAATRDLTTARGQRTLPELYEEDYAYRYPGPLPLGAQRLEVDGRTATVTACIMTAGWAVQRDSRQATSSGVYSTYSIVLRRQGGQWRVDQVNGTGTSCSDADVRGSR